MIKHLLYLALVILVFVSCSENIETNLIFQSNNFAVYKDHVRWNKYTAKVVSKDEMTSDYFIGGIWKRKTDISQYPEFSSDILLLDATYNLSLEELEKLKTEQGLFNTGALWDGVWTRDYSQSIMLSLSFLVPEIAKKGLLRKTKNGVIIQDTGTGGSWPVSTDRMIWTLAAWEVYKATGDKSWLKVIFPIVEKSAIRDLKTVFSKYGLVYGETTTMDWQENSYPSWMKAIEIFQSMSLSTNAIHYQTYMVLGTMAKILNEPYEEYEKISESIKESINKNLWIESLGYYGEFKYGKNFPVISGRSDAMGEALCVIFDIAGTDRKDLIMKKTPIVEYGIPLFYPFKPDSYSYHNNSVWPYVQAVWNLAAAKMENEEALDHGLASIYRSTAIFLSNKENFVASTGDAMGTAINSDRQLWSVAATLAMVYRVFFGMQFNPENLIFHPVIPKSYSGEKEIKNFIYRNAILDISVQGFGTRIKSFQLDGTEKQEFSIPGDISGKHTVDIIMDGENFSGNPIKYSEIKFTSAEPVLNWIDFQGMNWSRGENDKEYRIYENGKLLSVQDKACIFIPKARGYKEYQIEVLDKNGQLSFLSSPLVKFDDSLCKKIEIEDFLKSSDLNLKKYSGKGYVETNIKLNTKIKLSCNITSPGKYIAYVRYSNGNGEMCCTDKCAVRSFFIDGNYTGAFLLPIIEENAWSKWGESNSYQIDLKAGKHFFEINYLEQNENMNLLENKAILDYLCLIQL